MHPAASQRHFERSSLCPSFSSPLSLSSCPPRSLPSSSLARVTAVSLPPPASSSLRYSAAAVHPARVPTVLRRFLFFLLSVSFYWQQPPPTPSRFYTGKSIQPYVRLAGASAVLVHGFRNLLQLDRTAARLSASPMMSRRRWLERVGSGAGLFPPFNRLFLRARPSNGA